MQKEAIDNGAGFANLSLEKLPEYAGDYIFTSPWTGDTSDSSVVYDSSIWQGLPAVQNDRVIAFETDYSNYNDPIALEAQLIFIVESLIK